MKKQAKFHEESTKSWMPRIITVAVTFIAILYFFPHMREDSLYRFKEGQLWDHGDLVTQDSLIVPPDSATVKVIADSLRANFVPVYTPVDAEILNLKGMLDSIDMYLFQALPDLKLPFDGMFRTSPQYILRQNVKQNLQRFYRGKVIESEGDFSKPDRIALTDESRRFNDTITTLDEVMESITRSVEAQGWPADVVEHSGISRFVVPNVVLNKEVSNERFNAEMGIEIDSRTRIFSPGYRIVARGDLVSPSQGRLITLYTKQMLETGSADRRSTLLSIVGQALYILLILGILIAYMRFFAPRVWADNRAFIFIISLVGLFVVISAIVSKYLVLGLYVIPIVMVPILVQVFFHGRMALWAGYVTALLCAGMAAAGFQYLVIEFAGITVAVFSLRDLTKRSQLLQTSLFAGLSYIGMYVAYRWMSTGQFDSVLMRMIVILGVNAVLTSACYVLMFAVERIFGFISNVTLLELTDINTPLLRKLSDNAPGTFNHVMAVSNLADDAARQIGANALLTRAGAMYHDIGKLANPAFFTENQHGVNPHDGLDPKQSAAIIIDHVTEGQKLADKAGLPKIIRDFISEHHGKGQAKYFYYTYSKQHPDEEVDPAPFTYPGPNPRSRETSILMMADAVEAASRSLKEHTPQAISDLVNKIIDGQIADGLHNDSPLSFRDIQTIKDVFIRRLMTMYHSRIAYPDAPTRKS